MTNSTSKTVFLTGITGFLGSFLAKELLDRGYNVIGLARAAKRISAEDRVLETLRFVYGDAWETQFDPSRLRIVNGDLLYPNLGIRSEAVKQELISSIDIIIHSAALPELTCQYRKIKRINVDGTRNVLDFAMTCKEKGKLKKINHISTMYISGAGLETFHERSFEDGQRFNNNYERTKFEAERMLRNYLMKGLNCSVFRPSMIMGDSKEGKTTNFKIIYQPIHLLSREVFSAFPGDFNCSLNLIHIDTVAQAIAILCEEARADVYHLISPENVSIKDLMVSAADYFGYSLPEFIPAVEFDFDSLSPARLSLLRPFVPYLNHNVKFIADYTFNVYSKQGFHFPRISPENVQNIFKFCEKAGYVKKKEFVST